MFASHDKFSYELYDNDKGFNGGSKFESLLLWLFFDEYLHLDALKIVIRFEKKLRKFSIFNIQI